MKPPAIRKALEPPQRAREGGVTILLVAAALTATMAMAALSIDVVTLYLADANAQQAADSAALAGARILSLSGMTGDPQNKSGGWAAACTSAQEVAAAVGNQITVGGTVPASITVTFPNDASGNCSDAPGTNTVFGVNPEVQVKIQSTSLPTFFARIWGKTGSTVSAIATAEVFNSSNSGTFSLSGNIVPVQPRCVKPWIVPNSDPGNAGLPFVDSATGAINHPGIFQSGGGVIGESFLLLDDCGNGGNTDCLASGGIFENPPQANPSRSANSLDYIPALVQGPVSAVPSCTVGRGHDLYQRAIGGCDRTAYACGTNNGASADLSFDPGGASGDTATAVQCLTNSTVGADSLDPATFPFHIKAGDGNALVTNGIVPGNALITSSNSIVTVPIYDSNPTTKLAGNQPAVTIVGFLQLFIDNVDGSGNLNVHVLNVAGCSNNASNGVFGTSPVPVRLVTYP
jgi:Flp pilus assembly protein TadG